MSAKRLKGDVEMSLFVTNIVKFFWVPSASWRIQTQKWNKDWVLWKERCPPLPLTNNHKHCQQLRPKVKYTLSNEITRNPT
jgi:hypothetical protein